MATSLRSLSRAVPAMARRAAAAAPLRAASSSATSTWHKPGIAVEFDNVPQARVEEAIVHITFVNYAGERQRLPARVGDSLLDVAMRYGYKYVDGACGGGGSPVDVLHKEGRWFEPKYGEGAYCSYCHVIIPKSHYGLLPPKRPDETEQLLGYPFKEDLAETSRLACQVKVVKEMEGCVIYVPDGPRSDIP